jgi:hypothetical protein
MKDDVLYSEERNRKMGFYISVCIHLALLLLLFIRFVPIMKFPAEESGIMVVFGEEDAGQNSETYEAEAENAVSVESAVAPSKVNPAKDVVSTTRDEISEVKATDKKKTDVKKDKQAEENQRLEKLRQEKEEAERLAKEKDAAEKKKKMTDLFGKGKGSGSKPGDAGNPTGEPNGKVLDGITKGSGRVGGGLASRGLVFEPVFKDNSQRSGRVVLTLCVDATGKVISSKYTQKGSTTNDAYLIQLTEKTASKYKFSPGDADSQCGTITVDYKVQ